MRGHLKTIAVIIGIILSAYALFWMGEHYRNFTLAVLFVALFICFYLIIYLIVNRKEF